MSERKPVDPVAATVVIVVVVVTLGLTFVASCLDMGARQSRHQDYCRAMAEFRPDTCAPLGDSYRVEGSGRANRMFDHFDCVCGEVRDFPEGGISNPAAYCAGLEPLRKKVCTPIQDGCVCGDVLSYSEGP